MPYNSDIPKNIEEDQLSSFTHLEYFVQKTALSSTLANFPLTTTNSQTMSVPLSLSNVLLAFRNKRYKNNRHWLFFDSHSFTSLFLTVNPSNRAFNLAYRSDSVLEHLLERLTNSAYTIENFPNKNPNAS